MIPDKATRLKTSDILVKPTGEYRVGLKASLIGWLKELFLFGPHDSVSYWQTSTKDRNDYAKAVDILRKHARITRRDDLHDFEEKITAKKAVKLLNKTIKEMHE